MSQELVQEMPQEMLQEMLPVGAWCWPGREAPSGLEVG